MHGSFFAKIAKESKRAFNNLPVPDFKLLQTHKYYVRWALVAYLHLAQVMKTQPKRFEQAKNVMGALEQAIINVTLRNDLLLEAKNALICLCESESFLKSGSAKKFVAPLVALHQNAY